MKSFVATSTAPTAAEAGKEVAAKVAAGIESAKVAMAYGSCDYDSAELLAAIAGGAVLTAERGTRTEFVLNHLFS